LVDRQRAIQRVGGAQEQRDDPKIFDDRQQAADAQRSGRAAHVRLTQRNQAAGDEIGKNRVGRGDAKFHLAAGAAYRRKGRRLA
jgi:hypothetical protein